MKKISSLTLVMISFISSYAQLEIYKSISDYKNNTPEKHTFTDFNYYSNVVGSYIFHPIIRIKEDGNKIKIDLIDIWGFKYKNILFRRDATRGNLFVGLLSNGKINYWENAVFILKKIDFAKTPMNDSYYGNAAFLSTEIESPLISSNSFRYFFQNNKGFENLLQCVHDNSTLNDKKLKLANKVYGLGGEDNIALFCYFSITNNDKDLNVLRKCIKELNENFNALIPIIISKD